MSFPWPTGPDPIQGADEAQLPIQAPAHHHLPVEFVVRMAEEVWRLSKRTDRAIRVTGEEPLKGVRDSATRLQDTLTRYGIHVEDHSDQPYYEGARLDVAQVLDEPEEGEPLWIVETVRPTVLLEHTVLSAGLVIVGVRPRAEAST